ncbi:WD40 repeat-like protein [Meira miltonrushii]|uniref:Pre-rRNA-processing protein IPI3 n=1 Tax=Meira miltonrushii TaxID=1280837 RepID=A0A316V770_9BASI|nr:WD40 repeat-like protein [Meira miltonrushii]PWN33350.1 WD40 repeat-like protein [Meira miltonrushii]
MTQVARLGKEVVSYVLGPSEEVSRTGKSSTANNNLSSYAALLALNNPNASAPVGTLRGLVQSPSGSSWTTATSQDGSSTLMIHADRQRPVIHVHVHQSASGSASSSTTCPLTARLHPPESTCALAISPDGALLAAGSISGRLYVWHLASGHLLASLDAHFRAVSCLQWTADGRALVSASEDARIIVWSKEGLLDSTSGSLDGAAALESNARPSPFAILADHVEGITSIALSSSSRSAIASFPSLRIFSASKDGSVKLWDVRTRSLVATWTFNGPVMKLVSDVGFRSFFVIVRGRAVVHNSKKKTGKAKEADLDEDMDDEDGQEYDWVRRIDLFGGNAPDPTSKGSGSTASLFRIEDAPQSLVYRANADVKLTALAISLSGSHLLVGTSDTQLLSIDIASSVVIRTTPLVVAGQTGIAKASGGSAGTAVLGLSTFLIEDTNSLLQGVSMRTKGGAYGRSGDAPYWKVAEKLDRTILPTAKSNEAASDVTFLMRLERNDVCQIVKDLAPPSLREAELEMADGLAYGQTNQTNGASVTNAEEMQKAQDRIAELENYNVKLNELLKRAQKTNAGLWERVVQDSV